MYRKVTEFKKHGIKVCFRIYQAASNFQILQFLILALKVLNQTAKKRKIDLYLPR